LTAKARATIIDEIEKTSIRQLERSRHVVDYFEAHKKVPPIETVGKSPDSGSKTVVKRFNVIEGQNKGKVLYQYSDGSKEYK
jgi:hypothetical protein